MRKKRKNTFEKQRIVSVVFYAANLILLFFPWITVNEYRLNLFQLAQRMRNSEFQGLFDALAESDIETAKTVIRIELVLFGLVALFSIFYLITVLLRKNWKMILSQLDGQL